jgi:hypothetical protein
MSKVARPIFVKGERVTWEGKIRHGYSRAGDGYTGTGIITKIYESCIGGKRIPVLCAKIQIDESCGYPYFTQRTSTTIALSKLEKAS